MEQLPGLDGGAVGWWGERAQFALKPAGEEGSDPGRCSWRSPLGPLGALPSALSLQPSPLLGLGCARAGVLLSWTHWGGAGLVVLPIR